MAKVFRSLFEILDALLFLFLVSEQVSFGGGGRGGGDELGAALPCVKSAAGGELLLAQGAWLALCRPRGVRGRLERGDIYIADSHYYTAETNTTL